MTEDVLIPLFAAYERTTSRLRRSMSLGVNEFLLMFHLWVGRVPVTMGEMGRRVNVSSGGLTALVERLERNGYVTRLPDLHDRRRILLVLTEHGNAARDQFLQTLAGALDGATELDDTEREVVRGYLTRVGAALEELAAPGHPED